ncbi:uncharacterized protein EV154DRAFT_478872 [Mucor mucedo]|uniref:Early meiotic induction protein 1 n=1 Tax=Mucor saturninus TaxID=64648 RepID=A0A8H7RNG4_9FUNG|nr:uncharacterized protein EV154DRAFT_478872 [Mucor mucedo]KAG2213387.1 hypothetical protein INT47_009060 [Mucor saturninus]KAI7893817.1 hypothetical protein EV154DRAFT_478872 [Mucor mucedo]
MTDTTHNDDIDTTALFAEIEKEKLGDYETCSASETFDAAFQCYTLGAQAINYYRYGSKKDCAGKWEDFKFCLKTKTKSSELADAMLRERKANKEAARMRGRNSEEVWEAR